jgi:Mrp family chromosome partitioning ATPase
MFIALVLELLERRLCTSKDISLIKKFDLLLEFPRTRPVETTLISTANSVAPVAQLFRRMANDLEAQLSAKETKVVGVVSLESEAGRSTVATNLSDALIQKERQVVLVDADLRPKQSGAFTSGNSDQNSPVGLHEILTNESVLKEFNHQHNNTENLVVKSHVNQLPDTDSALRLGGQAMLQFRNSIECGSKWVIYDLPPIAENEAAFEAAVGISTVILVVRSEQTNKDKFTKYVERMERHGIEVAAVIITDLAELHLSQA